MSNENGNSITLPKLCYCSSARHGRAVVKALLAAGFTARMDKNGNVYALGGDAAFTIATHVNA